MTGCDARRRSSISIIIFFIIARSLYSREMSLRGGLWGKGRQGALCLSIRLSIKLWTVDLRHRRSTIQVALPSHTASLPTPTAHSTITRRPMLTLRNFCRNHCSSRCYSHDFRVRAYFNCTTTATNGPAVTRFAAAVLTFCSNCVIFIA